MSPEQPERPVGIVLAGGESRRLGSDKALLEVGRKSLFSRAGETLLQVCDQVVLADRGRGLSEDLPSVPDAAGRGPAAGILGAALEFPGRPLLTLACDLPRITSELLVRLVEMQRGADWVVPRHDGGLEPLCALYRPRAVEALHRQVSAGDFTLYHLEQKDLRVAYLEGAALHALGNPAELFLNINTPADLERLITAKLP